MFEDEEGYVAYDMESMDNYSLDDYTDNAYSDTELVLADDVY